MPEEYGDLGLMVPGDKDEASGADVPLSFRTFADSLDDALTSAEGKILIAQPGDVARFKAMSGDVSINKDGVTQIGNSKLATGMYQDKSITLAKLAEALGLTEGYFADGAVGSRKAKLTAGQLRATGVLSLVGASEYKDVAGTTLEITPAVNSLLIATIFANCIAVVGSASGVFVKLSVDGVQQADGAELSGATDTKANVSQGYAIPLAGGEKHTIKMVAKANVGEWKVNKEYTHWTYLLVAS